ncbi:hypothetical protein C2E21_1578 [Chlorella sorokiniana]|uniref:Uncharacterized protein n=1 Tax=Chlorella sorokiniana TaxID=3076 RepID=A0A2P6U1F8_CHLSO|nr:hypothetical protein C2E21_1578 [Chlorella sorokiniana]|eukprot:PRW60151.1 hypothetical protein C2E21_1578 [Chlorella sorokiniana]
MAAEQPPEQPAGSAAAHLGELQQAVAALQRAALDSEQQLEGSRAAAATAEAEAVLVAAYGRRLQRLAALLQQYDAQLNRALAALGLASEQHGQQHSEQQQQGAQPSTEALAALAAGLQQLEQQLATAVQGSSAEPLTPDALLALGSGTDLAAAAAAAGPTAILQALQADTKRDIETVNGWPSLATLASAASAEAALEPAFAQLQLEQKGAWAAADARRQRLLQLRAEVAETRQALAVSTGGETGGGEAAVRACLAAQQAGLRAELACLDRAAAAAEEQASAAAARVQQVEGRQAQVAALEQREAALDGTLRALCCADGQVMRQWRQGTWRAQEALEAGVLGQRQPLAQLAQRLLEAQQQELAAFRQQAASGEAAGASSCAAAQPSKELGAAAQRDAAVLAAAQLLDPLAHTKTAEHAAAVVAAASEELQGLQPVQQQWAELAAVSSRELAQLQGTAEELQQRVAALQAEGGSAALQQLAEAAAAAEEGTALVGAVRQAMTEHWTWPALTATPWVQREGRTAEEWLRLLSDQLRLQRQRDALADNSNRRRAVAI